MVIERDATIGQLVTCILAEESVPTVYHSSFVTALAWLGTTSTVPSLLLVNDRIRERRIEDFLGDYRRLLSRDVPIVLFTTDPRAVDRQEELGAVATLLKPFDVDDLVRLVRRHRARADRAVVVA